MLTEQSIQVVVPAKLQWLSVCPMISQSFEPVIEKGVEVVRLLILLRLRLRRGLVSPHNVCVISPPQNVRPKIKLVASSWVIKPCCTHTCTV